GDDVSERRAAAAPSEPTLRSRSGRSAVIRSARSADACRRAETAGPDHRVLRDRLLARALVLRVVSRTGCADWLPVEHGHHGHIAFGAAAGVRNCHGRDRAAPAAAQCHANRVMTPLEAEIRRIITIEGPIPIDRYM